MTRSKSKKSKHSQRKTILAMSTLTVAIGLALSANAQTSYQSATTESVKGRAPVVNIQGIVNETAAGRVPAPGDIVRVDATSTDPDADPIVGTDYRWTIDAAEVGTSQTYTVQDADAGDTLKVEVTARTNPANTDPSSGVAESTVVVAGTGGAPSATNVAIDGTPQVGNPLNGTYTFQDPENDGESGTTFQWYRADDASGTNKVAIPSATTQQYTPIIADEGKFIVFEVTPRSNRNPMAGVPQAATTQVNVSPADGSAPTASNLAIAGTEKVGFMLDGTYRYDDVEVDEEEGTTFQWYRATDAEGTDAVAIEGATAQAYEVIPADANMYLIFEVTPRAANAPKDGLPVRVATSGPIEGSEPIAKDVGITGLVKVGSTLDGHYVFEDAENDGEEGTTFQWYRGTDPNGTDAEAIPGANAQQFTLTNNEEGMVIFFEVTPHSAKAPRAGLPVRAVTLSEAQPLEGSAPVITGLRVEGNYMLGEPLRAVYDQQDADGDKPDVTYQWFAHLPPFNRAEDPTVPISGATSQVYVPTAELNGRRVQVEVTARARTGLPKVGNPVKSKFIEWVTIDGLYQHRYLVPFIGDRHGPNWDHARATDLRIEGTLRVGEILTGAYDFFDGNGRAQDHASSTHTWLRADGPAGTNAVVVGTGLTYVVQADDVGKFILFRVRANPVGEPTGSHSTDSETVTADAIQAGP